MRCTGIRWRDGRPAWGWRDERGGARLSPVEVGGAVRFAVAADGVRLCGGVDRGGRWTACPYAAELDPGARGDQCARCAALDRSSSVAADTRADDPRPYSVYLAYFGPGLRKVGITATGRGTARLLEQAAVCFTFLGEGPLMTARRTEAVLGTAARIPDRVASAAKRDARFRLPAVERRAAELRAAYEEVTALGRSLPDSLRPRAFEPVDHAALFGLDGVEAGPDAEVTALPPGSVLAGTVTAVAGHDLYVRTAERGLLLLDTRLTAGLTLQGTSATATTVPAAPVRPAAAEPRPLF